MICQENVGDPEAYDMHTKERIYKTAPLCDVIGTHAARRTFVVHALEQGMSPEMGNSSKIYLKNGYTYQTFFYYGKGWYPDKQMSDKVRGGFLHGEAFSKDGSPSRLDNDILTYELIMQEGGNFQTSKSSEEEMF